MLLTVFALNGGEPDSIVEETSCKVKTPGINFFSACGRRGARNVRSLFEMPGKDRVSI
jgi:hypothetical protein